MAFTKITAAGIGTTETVTLDGVSVINNESIGGNLTVTGNATIGGVLTYEDVTNVDSVGLITARNGIVVGSGITLSKDGDIFATGITTVSGNVKVGTGITLSPDGDIFATGITTVSGNVKVGTGITLSPDGDGFYTGVVTATTFKGDGSNLTGVNSDVVDDTSPQLGGDLQSNSHDIKIADASGYDGNNIYMGSDNDMRIHHDGSNFEMSNSTGTIYLRTDSAIHIQKRDGSTKIAEFNADADCELYHNGTKMCETSTNGLAFVNGKGIDFSAESGSAAGSSSALLDDYEQGSFTATMSNGVTLHSGNDTVYYIKVGNLVTIQAEIRINNENNNADTVINNLPFVATNHSTNFCPGPVGTYDHELNSGTSFAFVKTTQAQSTASFQCAGQDGTFRNLDARANGYLAFTLVYFTTF